MLVELAIADAYGFGFEFAPPKFVVAHNDGLDYVKNPNRAEHQPGTYSDDTQMSIGVTRAIMAGVSSHRDLAAIFLDQYHRDRRPGYASGFQAFLDTHTTPESFLANIRPDSWKNGAAMRAVPCGKIPHFEDALDYAAFQASLTHATQEGINSAIAVAIMSWCCCNNRYSEIVQTVKDNMPLGVMDRNQGAPVSTRGYDTVGAVLDIFRSKQPLSLADILRQAVSYTGDVDSVAAIAIGCASQLPRVTSNLNRALYYDLESGAYGKYFLGNLDIQFTNWAHGNVVIDELPIAAGEQITPPSDIPDDFLSLFSKE